MEKGVTGFHFQEIPIEEAQRIAIAGNGKYSVLQAELLERLPALKADKAFAFGLPGGKDFPKEERRALTQGINQALSRAAIGWRVMYSERDKLFVCVPKASAGRKTNREPSVRETKKPSVAVSPEALVEVAREVTGYHEKDWVKEGRHIRTAISIISGELNMSAREIAPHIGLGLAGVSYQRRVKNQPKEYINQIKQALIERGANV